MINFTKEELEQINYALYCLLYKRIEDESICKLMSKLQALIENYDEPEECEHESDSFNYITKGKTLTEFKCKKCGEFYR